MEIHKEYRMALETCPTPLMLVSQDGLIVLSNRRSDALFGYDEGELQGQSIDVLVPTDVRSYHPELRNAFFEVPTSRSMGTGRDLFGVKKNGDMIPVEIGLEPNLAGDYSMIMVSVIDIRERKANELKVRQAIDAATSAMVMVNEHGKIDLINQQTLNLFGYQADELLGQPIEKLVPARFGRKHKVYRVSYQNTRDRRSMGAGRDLYGLTKDGAEVPVEIGLNPIDAPEGPMVMATIIDITERKKTESLIREKNEELSKLNVELSEFAYSASHDLKAPLASIAGTLQFVEEDLRDGNLDEVGANVVRAQELAQRLAIRIEDLLALAKSDSLESELSELTVSELVDEVWQTLVSDKSLPVYLATDFMHKEPFHTQPARLYIILENLLSNAIKYKKSSTDDVLVEVKTWDTGDQFYLSVKDNGIGIPDEHLTKIFGLFKRGPRTGEAGSGVGLALVKKNADRLGGRVEVSSSGEGSIFTIALPHRNNQKEIMVSGELIDG